MNVPVPPPGQPGSVGPVARVQRGPLVVAHPPGQRLLQRRLEAVGGGGSVLEPTVHLQQAAPGKLAQVLAGGAQVRVVSGQPPQ